MMTRVLAVALLAASLAGLGSAHADEEGLGGSLAGIALAAGDTYTDDEIGISFAELDGWTASNPKNGPDLFLTYLGDPGFPPYISIEVMPRISDISLADLARIKSAELQEYTDSGALSLKSSDDAVIGKYLTHTKRATQSVPTEAGETVVAYRQVIIEAQDKFVIVTYASSSETFGKHTPELEQVLSTLDAGPAPPGSVESFVRTYTDETAGLSFTAPKAWTATHPPNGPSTILVYPAESGFPPHISVESEPRSSGMSLADIVELKSADLQEVIDSGVLSLQSADDAVIGKYMTHTKVAEQSLSTDAGETTIVYRQTIVEAPDQFIIFTYVNDAKTFEEHLPAFEEVLTTLQPGVGMASGASPATMMAGETYADDELGVSFAALDGWTASKPKSGPDLFLTYFGDPGFPPHISIETEPRSSGMSLADIVELKSADLQEVVDSGALSLKSSDDAVIGKYLTHTKRATQSVPTEAGETVVAYRQVIVEAQDKFVIVTYASSSETFGKHTPALESLLSTLDAGPAPPGSVESFVRTYTDESTGMSFTAPKAWTATHPPNGPSTILVYPAESGFPPHISVESEPRGPGMSLADIVKIKSADLQEVIDSGVLSLQSADDAVIGKYMTHTKVAEQSLSTDAGETTIVYRQTIVEAPDQFIIFTYVNDEKTFEEHLPAFEEVLTTLQPGAAMGSGMTKQGMANTMTAMQGDMVAVLDTAAGPITIEFFEDDAPGHVANFVKLAESGFYDGTLFHRIISGFMIQGGDPNTKDASSSTWGTGGPGYSIDAEFNDIPHERGIVSMARSNDPNSAGSQFFIVHQNSGFLDKQYTVFGRITAESYDTLDKIASIATNANDQPVDPAGAMINSVSIMGKGGQEDGLAMVPMMAGNTYADDELGVSFAALDGWTASNPKSGPDLFLTYLGDPGFPPYISIEVVPRISDISLADLARIKSAELQEYTDSGALSLKSSDDAVIGKYLTHTKRATQSVPTEAGETVVAYRQVIVEAQDKFVIVTYASSSETFGKHTPALEQVLSTLDAGPAPPGSVESFVRTYTDETAGLSFTAPKAWTATHPPNGPSTILVYPAESGFPPHISVESEPRSSGMSLADIVELKSADLQEVIDSGVLSLQSADDAVIGKYMTHTKVAEQSLSTDAGETTIVYRQTIVEAPDQFIIFTYVNDAKTFEEHLPAFEEVLTTLQPGAAMGSGMDKPGMMEEEKKGMMEEEKKGMMEEDRPVMMEEDTSAPGGCLIATAAYGTELAPQVQALRELRDGVVLQTGTGSAFMSGFSAVYYSFSPAVADLERSSPAFKETVRAAITPMIWSLAILQHAEIDSEVDMAAYGIAAILANLAMYIGVPAAIVLAARHRLSRRA